jgi:hypothetical protein
MRSGAHSRRHFERERLGRQSGAGWPPIPERYRRRNPGLIAGAALVLVSALVVVVNALAGAPRGEAPVATTGASQNLAGAPRYAGEKMSVRFHRKSGRGDSTRPSAALTTTPAPRPSASPPTTAAPAAAPTLAPVPAPAGRWIPPLGNLPWQWEIDHPLDLASASDMGTGVTRYGGAAAPNPVVYDIDGFDNPATTVAGLHARGFHVICYIEVGAAETYRPDYSQFPASALGNAVQGYPNERYLDIRSSAVVGVIENRIAMCAQKGFDAIEPDIDDSYTENTGFGLTMADDVAFNRTLANYAHGLGLSYGLKNGDDPSYAAQMLPIVDFALDEQCFQYSTCGAFFPSFRNAEKAVFEVEYNIGTSSFCPQAVSDGFNAVRQNVNLNGGRQPCS